MNVPEISSRGLRREQRVLPQVLGEFSYMSDVSIFPGDKISFCVHLNMEEITIVAYIAEGF